ncbi:TetR family transcriptional regulator [Pelagicoccus sp. NFK12]|uniref:TetR family transcriptional regulator n=1 Tax=Pelagicoccus enzymogenes TaxID=2773457 RepID=A0A927F8V4_9BACT|nr:TetR family transcriptional regulator [Pelagicoccus enzymogenes]MBD5780010.1 TetR family transcriptional regulator [Pelagicoccus enzymogenes]MDQ8198580.1 TetR/AcrR family transcriptional regulator [Pelagicoccus enzymogenes]
MNKTQVKLIEAAEKEFAEHGFHGASIRNITRRAGANVASVNYHFGSKETLFIEMIRYRLEPLNTLRIQMLDEAVAKAGKRPLKLKRIIDILVRPMVENIVNGSHGQHFMRAVGRGMSEESQFMQQIYKDVLAKVVLRFRKEMSRTLSDLPESLVNLCFAYLRSTLSGTLQTRKSNIALEDGIQFPDADTMVAYISGGIEAISKEYRTKNK